MMVLAMLMHYDTCRTFFNAIAALPTGATHTDIGDLILLRPPTNHRVQVRHSPTPHALAPARPPP